MVLFFDKNQLISFTEANVYDQSFTCVLVENITSLVQHVLLHACNLERNPCKFVQFGDKVKLNCIGSEGMRFLHNRVALARTN